MTSALVGLMLGSSALSAESWTLKASDKTLKINGKLLDPLNVSGIASVNGSGLIFACDELHHGVQAGRLDWKNGEVTVEDSEFSLAADTKKELDLESAAADPEHHRYYTCGSCSVSRKKGKESPDRQWLFRVDADAKTGALLADKVVKVSLRDAMNTDAFLHEHMDKSAAELGIDVEGLAFKEGRLWFGLRSPNVNGWGFVVAAQADALLAKKAVIWQRFELPLGEDLGIRDIAPVKGGFLLIAGPTGARHGSAPQAESSSESVAKAAPATKDEETVAKPALAAKGEETVAKPALAAKGGETVAKPALAAKGGETVAKPALAAKGKETVAKAAPAAKGKETVARAASAAKGGETVAKAAEEKKPASKQEVEAKPAAEVKPVFSLFFWPGDTSRPTLIGELQQPPADKEAKGAHGKPEALLVLNETAEKMDVAVFSDGATNGAPVLYEVARKGRTEGPIRK